MIFDMFLTRHFRIGSQIYLFTARQYTTQAQIPWFRVAIDGPAGAGKSTTARMLAGRLGFGYIDSGAMYRTITFEALRQLLDPSITRDHSKIVDLARQTRISFPTPTTVLLNDQIDVTQSIRLANIVEKVSAVAAIPELRRVLLERQRSMARGEMPELLPQTEGFDYNGQRIRGIVMDGRDIGSKVLPDAELKIYLTADLLVRAERRLEELKERDSQRPFQNLQSMAKFIQKRDEADIKRVVSPLVKTEDAVEIDTTSMTLEQQVEKIEQIVMERLDPWFDSKSDARNTIKPVNMNENKRNMNTNNIKGMKDARSQSRWTKKA